MAAANPPTARAEDEPTQQFPAYGPIEAALGYLLFYVLVDRVTATVVAVFDDTVPDLSVQFVQFGLAVALWFVFVVTAIDQIRRQLAALGVIRDVPIRLGVWACVTPSWLQTTGYLVMLVGGAAIAVVTFDPAVEALLSLLPAVSTVDTVGFELGGLVSLAVFFAAYGVATYSLDRLVIGGIRAVAPG